jgi:hypothetical protein
MTIGQEYNEKEVHFHMPSILDDVKWHLLVYFGQNKKKGEIGIGPYELYKGHIIEKSCFISKEVHSLYNQNLIVLKNK